MAEDKILAEAKATVNAQEDAFLSKLFPAGAPAPKEQEPSAEPAKAEAKEEEQAEAATAGSDAGKETEVETKAESDPEWEKACTALKLDGVPDAVLEGLDRAEALKWASKAKERQAKTANELRAKAEKIKELEAGVTTPKTESPRAPTVNGDDPLKAIRETFGDEVAAPLAAWMESQRSENSELKQRLELVESERVRGLIDGARASLREQFPQLDDPEKVAEAQTEMARHLDKYADLPPHERAQKAMRDAARVLWFDELKATEAGKALASYRKKMGAQPTPPNGKTPTQKPMTREQREDALLDAIFRGDGEEKKRLMDLPL